MYLFLVYYLKWLSFGKFLLVSVVVRNNRKWYRLYRFLLVLKGFLSNYVIIRFFSIVGFCEESLISGNLCFVVGIK